MSHIDFFFTLLRITNSGGLLLVNLCRCKLTCMMATGRTLVPLRHFIMQIWESPKSQCQISGCSSPSMHYHLTSVMINLITFMVLNFLPSFYDRSSPIYTQPRYLPPSKMLDADVTDSVIGEGCVIKVSSLVLGQ